MNNDVTNNISHNISHNIAYDRANMFYCINCGLWTKIYFNHEHLGVADFIVAEKEKNTYHNIINQYHCFNDGNYICKLRDTDKQLH